MNTTRALTLCDELEGVLKSIEEELDGIMSITPQRARAAWLAINCVVKHDRIQPTEPDFVRRACQYGYEWRITPDEIRAMLELRVRQAFQLMERQA
jgi:hypothetical protein